MKRILVPVDESEQSTEALEFATEEYPDAKFTALHVVDPGTFVASKSIEGRVTDEELRESHEQHAKKLLDETRETAAEQGIDLETEYVIGEVHRSIVDFIEDHDIDQVVIGSHGRTGASRVLLGSVAEAVTRRSPVPVTVVR